MLGIQIAIVALISAIPLNILVRMLGDENSKWNSGKSVITMFTCYSIGFAFVLFYMLPNKVSIDLPFSLLAWFFVIFFVIYLNYGLGTRKTLIVAITMTVFTSVGNISVTKSESSSAVVRHG